MSAELAAADHTQFPGDIPLAPMGVSASGKRWRLRDADARMALAIAQQGRLEPLVARILAARGAKAENIEAYLSPSLRRSMPDPLALKDMDRAVERLSRAITQGEPVGLFGDYDVDGTTAAAIFALYFRALGLPLDVYLPDRLAEGYGPSAQAFLTLKSRGAKVIVTVDCGASAHEPIEVAAQEGLDVVIIDHHQMSGPPPRGAAAAVNPNRVDDMSGLTNLSAAGVAFMTLAGLNRALREEGYFADRAEPDLISLLDLTALGLVCDVMPMTGLTRVLVAQGLKVLGAGGNPGLAALGARAGMSGPASAYHLGFLLGPRINAAGRIGHANLAFELLTTEDAEKRRSLAEQLHVMNAARQEIERDVQEQAIRDIEIHQRSGDQVIVTAGEGWHPGVIGIVAGRLKETYDRPVVVIGLDGDAGKGSGRSISGVDLGAAVARARQEGLLITGGGHAMAAGLSIDAEKIDAFRVHVNAALADDVTQALATRSLEIDSVVAPSAVSKAFSDMVALAGPYGPGNPEPLFALCGVRVERVKTVGDNHLSVSLVNDSAERARGIAFRAKGESLGHILEAGGRIHVAGKIRADDWRGGGAGQFHISDAAPAA